MNADQPDLFADVNSENSVTAAFKSSLERALRLPGHRINFEFNRMNSGAKRVPKRVLVNGRNKRALPDLVIHVVYGDGVNENLLAIEVKKEGNPEWQGDIDKLNQLTAPPDKIRPFQYRFGLALRYNVDASIETALLFENGVQTTLNPNSLQRN